MRVARPRTPATWPKSSPTRSWPLPLTSPRELDRAKTQLKASLFMARESLASRAEQAAAQLLVMGRLLTPEDLAQAIDRVTEAQVRAIGARALAAKTSAPAVLGPTRALAAADSFHNALFG